MVPTSNFTATADGDNEDIQDNSKKQRTYFDAKMCLRGLRRQRIEKSEKKKCLRGKKARDILNNCNVESEIETKKNLYSVEKF